MAPLRKSPFPPALYKRQTPRLSHCNLLSHTRSPSVARHFPPPRGQSSQPAPSRRPLSSTSQTMAVPAQPPAHPPKAPHIRAARAADAAAIAQLGAHVFSVTFGHSVPPHELRAYLDKDYSTAAITADLENPSKDTIVATDGGHEIVGFAILTRGTSEPCLAAVPNKVELQRIYVHPRAHGKGLGGALARRLEAMAREQGFASIWLGVWEENHAAQKAYEKWGYRCVGNHDFVVGTVVQTDHVMLKSL